MSTGQDAPEGAADLQPDEKTDSSRSGANAGAYELLRARLVANADELERRVAQLNAERIETFGSGNLEVVGAERVRTENNSVPRDIVAVGGDLLFGYNVFIGLKAETAVDDVLSLHHYRSVDGNLSLDPVPDTQADNWLHDASFENDFRELYTYYKDAKLLRLQRREGRLLAAFQTGQSLEDVRVFRWALSPDGDVSYIDNRGEREFEARPQFDFEWKSVGREHHVEGRNPHVNIEDRVFLDPTGGDLTIRFENNTSAGEVVLTEPVDDADQSLADAAISYAELGDLIVVSVLPYRESETRGFVVNTFTRSARRNDSVLQSCRRLPDDHGLITPSGYELRTGEAKAFDVQTNGMTFETSRRSPNGEDVLYVFHEPESGLSIVLVYNLIRRELSSPILAHGWSVFDDGSLIVFREDEEPSRIHPMQIWQTPFVSDEVHLASTTDDGLLASIGNAELVRAISDALNLSKQARDATPSRAVYGDLTVSAARLLDAHHWLADEAVGDLASATSALQATSNSIIDEFERVVELEAVAAITLGEATSEVEALELELAKDAHLDASAHVDLLRRLRHQRGHLVTLRDTRYIDEAALTDLDDRMADAFDQASRAAAAFFAGDDAFVSMHERLDEFEAGIESASKTIAIEALSEEADELGDGFDVLSQIVGSLEIDDPTVRTQILERLAEVTARLNRTRAMLTNRRQQLVTSEGAAAFSVEMTLFSQSVSAELARASTPDGCDEALGKLLLTLEDLEGRFAEFDSELDEIQHRREEVYEALSSRKQSLLDDRQRASQRMLDTADRILTSVARRVERFDSDDDMNAWFVSDPMVEKVRRLADELRSLDQPVPADELLRRLDAARDDAARSLRDRADLFEDGGNIVRFGSHRFSVDTEPLELTVGLFDDEPHAVLLGTDYREPFPAEARSVGEGFWNQRFPSETDSMSRAEFLAATIVLDALDHRTSSSGAPSGSTSNSGPSKESTDRTIDELLSLSASEGALAELVRNEAATRVDEGYERGVHDHDAALLVAELADRAKRAGLLRWSPQVRSSALFFWALHLDDEQRNELLIRCRSLGRLREQFRSSPAIDRLIGSIAESISESARQIVDARASAAYLFEELSQPILEFAVSERAVFLSDAMTAHQVAGDQLATEVKQVEDPSAKISLAEAWFESFAAAERPDDVAIVAEAVTLVVLDRLPRTPVSADLEVTVDGLLSQHGRFDDQTLTLRADEVLTHVESYRREGLENYRTFQEHRIEVLAETRDRLRLEEFAPKVMSAFVRNGLIDQAYLPLIGDNLAKQLGAIGEDGSARTDQMGLLLLISPPGYGKTTLMEYVANRLGMVFVKVNGPALGTGVTSLDPTEAPNATAAQEVDKINFALEMGSNVLLYLDDIQHTNPELLQKFISMTDAQRRMEGVWNGSTRTYDLRGKRFAVVMAGNPYTESGERFSIPDMLANRADTYNLGDVLSGREDLFALSYIENALASSPVLRALTTRDLGDVPKLVAMAKGRAVTAEELSHPYQAAELAEVLATLTKLLSVQDVLLSVNRNYIASAAMADESRVEPPFQLQGSYRNMARLAEKVLPVMNEAELAALIDDHYRSEAQTLTSGAESNLLKLAELRSTLDADAQKRWDEVKESYRRASRRGGSETDPMSLVAESLEDISNTLKSHTP